MGVDERARAGLFLAMQYPVEVPGVSVSNFLRTAATALRGEAPKLRTWVKEVNGAMDALEMDKAFAERSVNEGFSGGEKKRHEILQLELLKPKIAILDETDSGLDVDALRVVSEGVNRVRETGIGTLLITHYTRILRYIRPDFVHVFFDGRIVESGGPELADRLEEEGYARFGQPKRRARPSEQTSEPRRQRRPQGFPDPCARGARRAAGVPGQREHLAEAAGGAGHADRLLRAAQRERRPRRPHPRLGGDQRLRAGPGQGRRRSSNAPSRDEVVFTKNSSEALNLVAYSISNATTTPGAERFRIGPGDEIVVTEMEHHSNIVPWQLLAQRTGATFRWLPIDDEGRLIESSIDEIIGERTKIVALRAPVERVGHDQPGRPRRRPGEVDGRADRGRRLPVGATPAARRPGARRGLPRLHRAQDVRADRRRRVVGTLRAARAAAAVPRRWRDDRDGRPDRHHLRGTAAPLRGGHADDRPGGGPGRRDRLRVRARHGPDRGTRARAGRIRAAAPLRHRGPADHRSGERCRPWRNGRVHARRCAPPRRRPSCWTNRGSRYVLGITARDRCACVTEYRRPRRASFGVYTTTEEIDALVAGIERVKELFG